MKGFTLLEILVTVLIFTFILAGMYNVLNLTKTNYDTNLVSLNLQRQARQGMSWVSREIRQAYLSSIVIGNDTITFNRTDATGVEYSVNAGQLKRKSSTDPSKVIANDITGLLSFARSEGSNIQKIKLGASKTFHSGGRERTLTFSLTQQVEVRNP